MLRDIMFAFRSSTVFALRGVLWALLLLEFLASPRRAEACSCIFPRHLRQIFPAAGTVDFPTNGAVRILLRNGFPDSLAAQLPKEYRLIDTTGATGAEVTLTTSVEHDLITLTPAFGLRPKTRYTLEQVQAYDGNGNLVEDRERFELALAGNREEAAVRRLAPVKSRRFLPVRTFTTAAGPSAETPPRGTISRVGFYSRNGGGDCGPGRHFTVEYTLERALHRGELLALESQAQGILFYLPPDETAPTGGSLGFGNLLCETQYVQLRDGDGLRLVTVSPSNTRRPDDAFFAVGKPNPENARRADHTSAFDADQRIVELPTHWFAPPLVTTPVRTLAGPARCPHGLASTGKWQLGEPASRLEPTPQWLGERPARTVGSESCDGNTLQLFERRGETMALTTLPLTDGCHPQVAFSGQRLVAATIPARWNNGIQRFEVAPILLSQYDADKLTPRWQSKLGDEKAEKSEPFVVLARDRLLLAHVESIERPPQPDRQLLHLQIVSLRDGKPLSAVHTEPDVDYSPHLDAIFDGEQFVVAWQMKSAPQGRHRLRLLRITLDGKADSVHAFGGLDGEQPALATTDAGIAVAYAAEAGVQLVQVPRGQRKGTIFPTVSAGTPNRGRAPRLTARGDLLAIAWQAGDDQIFTTVVDSTKAIARPLAITPPGTNLVGAIAPHGDGFAIVYNTWSRTKTSTAKAGQALSFVETLTCRDDPPEGPPLRIVP